MKSKKSSWFKGIKGRMLMVAVFPFIAFATIFGFTYKGLDHLSNLLNSAHNEIIPNLNDLGDMRIAQNRFGYRVWEGIINPEDRAEVVKQAEETLTKFEKAYKEYTENPFHGEELKIYENYKQFFPQYKTLARSILTNLEKGSDESVAQARKDLDETLHIYSGKIEEFCAKVNDLYTERAVAENKEFAVSRAQIVNIIILVTLCAGLIILALQLMQAAKISNVTGSVADKLGESNSKVVHSVEQLAAAGNALSQNSTEAAASLEETVAALEELTSMVQMNSDNAKQAASLAVSSRDAAEHGEQEISALIKSMGEISSSSKKIEEIISVIDDIAFQTNLLALNAAVEAARAGEQGKGFAVVAEAVRALAQRSASSAKDIESLIKVSVHQVDNGSKVANSSGVVLANIVASIKKVSDLNNEIAAASTEQTTGIQQISRAMNQLDQSAQSNAASAEEIAATTTELNRLAQTSQDLTDELNTVVTGSAVRYELETAVGSQSVAPRPASSKSTTKAKFAVEPSAKVIPMKKSVKTASVAEETIPFDDEPRAKIGNRDGF
ncbi:methyl-accepting chemotaxis protein [Bdellovibrio sp. KM01]|uniref:HAMP domain-containing methyl-accepting chemotaxis protein n=1 Tax=Bdellovibrio sp. KM01 TaxID=2748865 RepID=UPI0015E91F91|nr:methyl-accepting chemotaxis protein [Bdellovibrio sp. KM01]QLY26236.1 MCP four helix bundle domain-containing protein [Bdellovibrio sp. KM01]